ncbi:energy-coupling factor ABC transporter ATP-binding protein [Leucobacter allii]|uniref:Energy-coupling factor ABC transporter ATP-binding protein n=1 Tax=Leucobacter allii TaxID=2932247 RepID=A0ABY4FLP9_9MICO|nr:ABC transporter ATP-binding protein [Leucobacter allii]UOQ57171.1 energy-coupling factor ABC transporter ATP-binding protein [Leucobacter allii]
MMNAARSTIRFDGASVSAPAAAGDVRILAPTTLTLSERRISVIGGNGSGKSTLARLVNGLLEPSSGSVGIELAAGAPGSSEPEVLDTRRDGAAVRRRVGFVFTDPAAQLIMPTVLEDVALSLRRRHRDAVTRTAAARATLERFGLAALAERSVHALSGGQKQMLAIASVLATEPAVLVADEPTTLLDLRNARMIGELLMSLPQQLLVVTHDLELAARADRTLVIADGGVVFDGPPAEAIARYRDAAAR